MPPDVREWLPEGHLAWFVIDAVEEMDLDGVLCAPIAWDGRSRPAYDPAMMVALLLYAYARGIAVVAADRAGVRGGRRVPRDGGAAAARSRDDRAVRRAPPGRDRRPVRRGAVAVREAGAGERRGDRGRRDEAGGQREPQRERRLRAARARDPRRGQGGRRGRGRALRRRARRRAARAAAHRRGPPRRGCARPSASSKSSAPKEARPVPRSRGKRLKEAKRRLDEELWTEMRANRAYEHYRCRAHEGRAAASAGRRTPTRHRRRRRARSTSPIPTRTSSRARAAAGSCRATTRRPSPTSTRS